MTGPFLSRMLFSAHFIYLGFTKCPRLILQLQNGPAQILHLSSEMASNFFVIISKGLDSLRFSAATDTFAGLHEYQYREITFGY